MIYAWIWRRLPGGPVAKTIGLLLLIAAAVLALWFVVFPWVTPLLPFDDVTIE